MQDSLSLTRRRLLQGLAALGAPSSMPVRAVEPPFVRIGYQKGGSLLGLLKIRSTLEQTWASRGRQVLWSEFPAGPQVLEAMSAGGIDFGYTGAPPPIFSQAAGNDLVYAAAIPIGPSTEAVVVKAASRFTGIAQLKGRSIALQNGSSAHYLLLAALEKADLAFSDIQPVYLAPAYARAAFETDRVDAWAIWDPHLASAQASADLRVIADYSGLQKTYGFFLASRAFVNRASTDLALLLDELVATGDWAVAHQRPAAELLAQQVGLPRAVVDVWQQRTVFAIQSIDAKVLASQQAVADAFYEQHLISTKVDIARAVWKLAAST